MDLSMEWKYWLGGLATLLTGGAGAVGNIVSLVVLCRRQMRNIFNLLLVCLCIADLIFLLSNLLVIPIALGRKEHILTVIYPIAECLCHISLAVSIFLTVSISLERFQAVCFPLSYNSRTHQFGHPCLITSYVLPSVFFAIILNIPRILEILPIGVHLQEYRHYLSFYMYYQVFHPLATTGIFPIFFLIVLNFKLCSRIPISSLSSTPRRRRASDFLRAKICSVIVLVFIFCNLPRLIIGSFEVARIPSIMRCHKAGCHYFAPTNQFLVDFIARYLAIFNSSINFIIYCLVGSQFRNVLLQMLGLKINKITEDRSKSASLMSLKLHHSSTRTTMNCEEAQSLLVTLTQRYTRSVSPMSQMTITLEDSPISATTRMFNLTFSSSSLYSNCTPATDTKL